MPRQVDPVSFATEMGKIIDPMVENLGAKIVYSGAAGPEFAAGDDWDFVSLVRCPDYEALLALVTDESWIAEAGLLREIAQSTRMVLTYPAG